MGKPSEKENPQVKLAEALLAELNKAFKAFGFYPPDHPTLKLIVKNSFAALQKGLGAAGELCFEVSKQGFFFEEEPLGRKSDLLMTLAKQMFQRRITRMIFLEGFDIEEFATFLSLLSLDADEIYLRGGLDQAMVEKRIERIWVNKVDFERLKHSREEEEEEEFALPLDLLDFQKQGEVPEEPQAAEEPVEDGSPEARRLTGLLRDVDSTEDPDRYFQGLAAIVNLADHFVTEKSFVQIFRIISTLSNHARDPGLGVAYKKYSIRALRKLATPRLIEFLVSELCRDDKGSAQIESILDSLATFGRTAAPVLVACMESHRSAYAQKLIAKALVKIGRPIDKKIYDLAGHDHWIVVKTACEILGSLKDDSRLDLLQEGLDHKEAQVRVAALRALIRIGTPQALNILLGVLLDENVENQVLIARALGYKNEVRAVPVLTEMVRKKEIFIKSERLLREVFSTLERIGGEQVEVALLDMLCEKRWFKARHGDDVALNALQTLGAIVSERAFKVLSGKLPYKSAEVVRSLGEARLRIERRLEERD